MRHTQTVPLIALTLLVSVGACSKKKETTTSTSSSVGSTTGFNYGTTGGSTTSGTTGSTTTTGGSVTAGSTSGGGTSTGGGQLNSPFSVNVVMAGGQSWYHGFYPSGTGDLLGNFIQILSGNYGFLAGDARYKVKVTVLDQPTIGSTQTGTYCYGRINGAQPPFWYTKVRFSVGIRDILCTSADPTNCTSFSIGSRYSNYASNVINVGSSQVFDFSNVRNRSANVVGHAVDVWDVKSDSATCWSPSSSCNPNLNVNSRSCWSVDLAVATDNTTDL